MPLSKKELAQVLPERLQGFVWDDKAQAIELHGRMGKYGATGI